MKNLNVLKVTKYFLMLSAVFAIMVASLIISNGFLNGELSRTESLIHIFTAVIGGPVVIFIIIMLRSIVKTVEFKHAFCTENIVRFRRICFSVWFIGAIHVIFTYPGHSGFDILASSYGSVKLSGFVYVIFGFAALVSAEIIKQAIDMKNKTVRLFNGTQFQQHIPPDSILDSASFKNGLSCTNEGCHA